MIPVPCADNQYLAEHAELLLNSLFMLTGNLLLGPGLSRLERARRLFEAPFAVVSHDTAPDPIFNYGNQTALRLFEMEWEAFTRLPSRYSAEQPDREERARLLARVSQDGFIDDYQGVRISASGKRFRIEEATIWNLSDEQGQHRGQAAVLLQWSAL